MEFLLFPQWSLISAGSLKFFRHGFFTHASSFQVGFEPQI